MQQWLANGRLWEGFTTEQPVPGRRWAPPSLWLDVDCFPPEVIPVQIGMI